MRRLLSSKRAQIALSALAATLAGAAIVHAQSGGSGTISACVAQDGTMHVLSDYTGYSNSFNCAANQGHVIDWNRSGPAGATGPTGATGPQGPSGDGGAPRTFVAFAESGPRKITNHAENYIVHADCPAGHAVTGGGYSTYGTATLIDQDYVAFNGPDYRGSVNSTAGTASSWVVNLVQSARGPGTAGVSVYALCLGDPPPGFGDKPKSGKVDAKITRPLALNSKLSTRKVIRVP